MIEQCNFVIDKESRLFKENNVERCPLMSCNGEKYCKHHLLITEAK